MLPAVMDYRYRILSFVKEDGRRIGGKIYYPGEKKGGGFPAVIFCPGFGVSYKTLEHYGPWFAQRGLVCLFFDFCGGSPDSESEGYTTMMSVLTEVDDLLFVLQEAHKMARSGEIPVNEEKIFLMGESQGGYVAALTGSRHPEKCAGLVLWYPGFCLQDMGTNWKNTEKKHYAREMFGIPLGRKYTEDAYRTQIYEEIAAYRGPAFLVHGDVDEIVPIDYSRRAVRCMQNARLLVIEGAGHGFEEDDRWIAAEASLKFCLAE